MPLGHSPFRRTKRAETDRTPFAWSKTFPSFGAAWAKMDLKLASVTVKRADNPTGIVAETGKSITQVARDLGISPYTLHNWVQADRHQAAQTQAALTEDERAELARSRAEKARWAKEKAELDMERDVLKVRREALLYSRLTIGDPPGSCR